MRNQHKQLKIFRRRKLKQRIAMVVFILGLLVLAYEPLMNLYIEYSVEKTLVEEVKPLNEVIAQDLEQTDLNKPVDTYYDMDSRQIVIGKLAIPSVSLKLSIIKGVGQENGDPMEKGAATNKEGQEMGLRNYVLSSHAMKDPTLLFSPLFNVDYDDKMYVTDEENVYVYNVTAIETVEPERVDILDDVDGRQMITLYTCTQAGSKRIVITGDLVETSEYIEKTATYFNN
ncbi:class A sortase [Carnobacterium pleistocenium]|uniref:class A sortase n=1 Tax=Carnobacterium pleistocenium TaxID=181073 RepID=UPI0006912546|nr:class A sortase [Carnobacterium pleistocenium]